MLTKLKIRILFFGTVFNLGESFVFFFFKGYPRYAVKLKGISYFRRMRLLRRLVNNSGACGYQNVFLKRNMGTGIAKNNVSC